VGAAILDASIGKLSKLVTERMRSGRGAGGGLGRTLSALSWVFGFLLLMRFFSERMASLGCTVFDLMMSEISRLRAMSSLWVAHVSQRSVAIPHYGVRAIVQAAARGLVNLLIQGSVGAGRPPPHHLERMVENS